MPRASRNAETSKTLGIQHQGDGLKSDQDLTDAAEKGFSTKDIKAMQTFYRDSKKPENKPFLIEALKVNVKKSRHLQTILDQVESQSYDSNTITQLVNELKATEPQSYHNLMESFNKILALNLKQSEQQSLSPNPFSTVTAPVMRETLAKLPPPPPIKSFM